MLEEVLRYINNRFDRDAHDIPYGYAEGEFTIEGGSLVVEGLKEGQHFWVEGSVLNDGLHCYPADDLTDETFTGRLVFLGVPRQVQAVAEEIEAWCQTNAEVINGPFKSESFGGYSYTKDDGEAETPQTAWQSHFGGKLRQWRKLSRDWL